MSTTVSKPVEPEYDPLPARVRAIIEEVIEDPPYFLVDVSIRGREGSRVVEVFVDRDEGISIEALADLSREIGFLLETEDIIKGRYYLTVSSPGADRPLVMPRQFRRHSGRPMRLVVRGEDGAEHTVRGILATAGDDDVELKITDDQPRRVRYADIVEARIELPW
ncbi:MAG: ribosome maturation factor RimP [Rhodothermales bacterium]|nr:ribosome maturation factor RimP [Rhodothermales bacterium]